MKIMNFTTGLTRKIKTNVKKYSPELLIAAGTASAVGCVVCSCKATLKVQDILEEKKELEEQIKTGEETLPKDKYSEEDAARDRKIVKIQTGVKIAKTYAPAALMGVLALSCFIGANGIQRKRIAGLSAAYSALDISTRGYRERVKEAMGSDDEEYVFHNLKKPSKGKKQNKSETIEEAPTNANHRLGGYSKFFDASSRFWTDDADANLRFLLKKEKDLTNRLEKKGSVTINEVYRALDIPTVRSGETIGWRWEPGKTVSFGLFNTIDDVAKRRFINGYENVVILDFNVDGVIF